MKLVKAVKKATTKNSASKANKRGLKAANKPTNKVGSKSDKKLRARTKSVQMSKEETKAQYDYYYGKGSGEDITQINRSVVPKNEARSVRMLKSKPKKENWMSTEVKKKKYPKRFK